MKRIEIVEVNEGYTYCQLPCGLRVYLMSRPHFHTTCAYLASNYGSCDNEFIPYNQKEYATLPDGIAHFLEHKLFESQSQMAPEDLFSQYGAEYNAYTTNETTAYNFATTNNVGACLKILIDFVLQPDYSENGIEKEKDIIEQELLMYLDRHQTAFHLANLQALYQKHPVRVDIGGTVESIKKIDKSLLDLCHRTFYHPRNMVLVMVGPFNNDEIFEVLNNNEVLKKWENYPYEKIKRRIVDEDVKVNHKELTIYRDVFVPSSRISLKLPFYNLSHQEMVKLSFAMRFWLHYGFSKIYPFYQKLHDLKIIDKGIHRTVEVARTFAYVSLTATTDRYQEWEKATVKKLLSLKKSKPTEQAFKLYQKMVIASLIAQFDFNDSICTTILNDALNEGSSHDIISSIRQMTLDDVLSYRYLFNQDALSIVRMLPRQM